MTMMATIASISTIFVLCIAGIDAEFSKDARLHHVFPHSVDPSHPSSSVAKVLLLSTDSSRVRRRRRQRSAIEDFSPSSEVDSTADTASSSQSFVLSNFSISSAHSPTFHGIHSEQSRNTPRYIIKTFPVSFPADSNSSSNGSIPDIDQAELDPSFQNSSFPLENNDDAEPFPSSSTAAPTVSSLTGENVTVIEDQNHVYYRSSVAMGMLDAYWANEDVMFGVTEHASLSNSHRSAATIPLSFTFQFYGHEINQVTIATGGRLFPVSAAQGNFGQQLRPMLLLLQMLRMLRTTVSIDDAVPRGMMRWRWRRKKKKKCSSSD